LQEFGPVRAEPVQQVLRPLRQDFWLVPVDAIESVQCRIAAGLHGLVEPLELPVPDGLLVTGRRIRGGRKGGGTAGRPMHGL
jgi:hypothetical protein